MVQCEELMKGRHNGLYLGSSSEIVGNKVRWTFDCPFDETLTCYRWEKHVDGSLDLYSGSNSLLEHYDGPISHVSHYEVQFQDESGDDWMHYEETFQMGTP